MRERPNRHAWKACVGKLTVGSNPTPSAMANPEPSAAVSTTPTLHAAWMQLALDEARAALEHGDVPVGAVVVRDGDVLAERHNERELTGDPTAHAEILALRDAAGARETADEVVHVLFDGRGVQGSHSAALTSAGPPCQEPIWDDGQGSHSGVHSRTLRQAA